jgi:hypothetical protein
MLRGSIHVHIKDVAMSQPPRRNNSCLVMLGLIGLIVVLFIVYSLTVGGGTAPVASSGKTVGELCFPGMTDAQWKKAMTDANIISYVANDDFGQMAIAAKSFMKCDKDVAFGFLWSVYTGASSTMKHAIIDQSQAQAAFNRNWDN